MLLQLQFHVLLGSLGRVILCRLILVLWGRSSLSGPHPSDARSTPV